VDKKRAIKIIFFIVLFFLVGPPGLEPGTTPL